MPTIKDEKRIEEILSRGVEEVIVKEHLKKQMLSGEKLRVKFGIDPTSPDLHLGHSIPLRKLRQFQELGHQVIFLIGDFTAQIGDPTGKSSTRKPLTEKEIKDNMKEYTKQAGKILDLKKIELRYNSEWYNKKEADFIIELTSKFTFARLIERDDFQKRLKADIDISMHELIYPLLQGYDSVELKADVEIGGTDQKFNLLYGRKVQKRYGLPEQDIITLPLLIGTDGINKMSKSLGNFIKITEKPFEMFGFVMSIPDILTWNYYHLLTNMPDVEVEKIKEDVRHQELSPMKAKNRLAKEIVGMYHGAKEAEKAETEFNKVFRDKEMPSAIPEFKTAKTEYPILDLLKDAKLCESKAQARRLVEQGAVEISGKVWNDWQGQVKITDNLVIQAGKRKFVKIKIV